MAPTLRARLMHAPSCTVALHNDSRVADRLSCVLSCGFHPHSVTSFCKQRAAHDPAHYGHSFRPPTHAVLKNATPQHRKRAEAELVEDFALEPCAGSRPTQGQSGKSVLGRGSALGASRHCFRSIIALPSSQQRFPEPSC